LRDKGYDVLLPVVLKPKTPLEFRRWLASSDMREGPYGILEPGPDAKAVRPDLMLVPLLAFDRNGNRLGYGGGFYDVSIRAIRKYQPVTAVGVAYAAQQVSMVPHDAHDTRLDWIITENGNVKPEVEFE
jgi:5-formyltetrahydrofolate cyclo-ligase